MEPSPQPGDPRPGARVAATGNGPKAAPLQVRCAATSAARQSAAIPRAIEALRRVGRLLRRRGGLHRLRDLAAPAWRHRSGSSGSDLDAWLKRRPDEVHAAAAQLCAALGAPPSWPEGLPQRRPLLMGVVNVTRTASRTAGSSSSRRRRSRTAAAARRRRRHRGRRRGIDPAGRRRRVSGRGDQPRCAGDRGLARAGALVSIDTRKAAVMRAAVGAGARMINDISALRMTPTACDGWRQRRDVVLMHSQGEPATMQLQPRYERGAGRVRPSAAARAGLDRRRL